MSKRKPKFKHIYIKTFGANIYYVCCNRERYEELIKKEFDKKCPERSNTSIGTTEGYERDGTIIDVIWHSDECSKDLSVAVHEAFHAAHNILQHKGMWLTDSSEEAYAYLLQQIVQEIIEFGKASRKGK
ncbi:hypothetical protein KAR91_20850 [Candidatus Pacearchaeota archaeon]|nr:hypothetical protein [Candidatus Pacearchaeota archaeon]